MRVERLDVDHLIEPSIEPPVGDECTVILRGTIFPDVLSFYMSVIGVQFIR